MLFLDCHFQTITLAQLLMLPDVYVSHFFFRK